MPGIDVRMASMICSASSVPVATDRGARIDTEGNPYTSVTETFGGVDPLFVETMG